MWKDVCGNGGIGELHEGTVCVCVCVVFLTKCNDCVLMETDCMHACVRFVCVCVCVCVCVTMWCVVCV